MCVYTHTKHKEHSERMHTKVKRVVSYGENIFLKKKKKQQEDFYALLVSTIA